MKLLQKEFEEKKADEIKQFEIEKQNLKMRLQNEVNL